MDTISVREKNAVFKAADEQVAARTLAAGLKEPNANLISRTFRKLDIESLAATHINRLEKKAVDIRADYNSGNLTKRVDARAKLKASLDLRVWKAGKAAGIQLESEKLEHAFKTSKGVN